jgi:chromosomal replication initiation ATPase DnaA
LKQVTGYHTTDLQKKDGRREMTVPRQIGMFFYLRAGYSLAQSAMRFHRDHSNAVYARYQIMNLYGQVNERKLTEFVDAIERITGIESGLRVNTFTAVNEPTEVNI